MITRNTSHVPIIIDRIDSRRMIRRRLHVRRIASATLAFCTAVGLSGAMPGAQYGFAATPPGSGGGILSVANGTYQIHVAGYYTTVSDGSASIGSGKVHISATVKDEAGNTGILRADVNLVQTRFSGVGTVMGLPISIEGRIDAADQKRTKVTDAQIAGRVVATFVDGSLHHSRIAGRPNHSPKPG